MPIGDYPCERVARSLVERVEVPALAAPTVAYGFDLELDILVRLRTLFLGGHVRTAPLRSACRARCPANSAARRASWGWGSSPPLPFAAQHPTGACPPASLRCRASVRARDPRVYPSRPGA